MRSAVSSGQSTATSRALMPGATSSPNSKPSTAGPPANSCRPARWQSTRQPKRSAKRPLWR